MSLRSKVLYQHQALLLHNCRDRVHEIGLVDLHINRNYSIWCPVYCTTRIVPTQYLIKMIKIFYFIDLRWIIFIFIAKCTYIKFTFQIPFHLDFQLLPVCFFFLSLWFSSINMTSSLSHTGRVKFCYMYISIIKYWVFSWVPLNFFLRSILLWYDT